MPIPILKMKGLRRTGVAQGEVSRIAPPDNNACLKTPSALRTFSRTAAVPGGGNQGVSTPGASSSIPAFKGKDIRFQPQPGRSQFPIPGSAPVTPASKQTRSTPYGYPKTPTHSRQAYRSHLATTNLSAGSTPRASSGTTTFTPRASNANERLKKYGLPKPSAADKAPGVTNIHQTNNNHISSLSSYCGDTNTNSNRSSIISNCSSIPAPSSSSSNRNSSSSISSNFSVGSWSSNCAGGVSESREPRSYPGASGGSDTFPRTNSIKRSKHPEQIMVKSMDGVDHRSIGSNNNSLQRPSNRPRLREPQKISRPAVTQMSASESAITTNSTPARTHPSSTTSHTSESNLSKLRFDRQQEGRQSSRSIPKPTATVRGKSKISSSIPNHASNIDQRTSTHRSADHKVTDQRFVDQRHVQNEKRLRGIPQTQNKRAEIKTGKDNVALVSPFATNVTKIKSKDISAPSLASSQHCPPLPPTPSSACLDQENNVKVKNTPEIDALEEDDGYSSVVNTDQHEDDDTNCTSDANSRAECDELLRVEPMKPLEGISSYSYLQSFREYKARRSYPYCSNPTEEGQRNSVPIDLQVSKWQFEQHDSSKLNPPSCLKSQNPPQSTAELYLPKADTSEVMSPYSQFSCKTPDDTPSKPVMKNYTSVGQYPSNCEKQVMDPPAHIPFPQLSSPIPSRNFSPTKSDKHEIQSSSFNNYSNTSVDGAKSLPKPDFNSTFCASPEPIDNSRPKSIEETFASPFASYSTHQKQPLIDNSNYSWMARNTIAGILPVVPPNRKYAMVGNSAVLKSPQATRPSPSLPALTNVNAQRDRTCEPRPISLDSSKLSYNPRYSSSSCPSPLFYRSGSLRSPARLLVHTPPPPEEDSSTPRCPSAGTFNSSFQSFVRGSPKYSTVIPCTSAEDDAYLNDPTSQDLLGAFAGVAGASPYLAPGQLDDIGEEDLRKQLIATREKVFSLTEQLASSNKLVTAYEHSLTNMTHRLHQLTVLNEKKETEVSELRKLLERSCYDGATQTSDSRSATLRGRLNRGASVESLSSLASNISLSSELSSTSLASNNSFSSCDTETKEKASKKRNWFRSSFSKAFKRREKRKRGDVFSQAMSTDKSCCEKGDEQLFISNLNEQNRGYCSLPSSPLPLRLQNRLSDILTDEGEQHNGIDDASSLLQEVSRLKKVLIDRDSSLTESRLESLSSAHQIESLRESVQKLSSEVNFLKNTSSECQGDDLNNDEFHTSEQLHFEVPGGSIAGSPGSSRSSVGSLNDTLVNISPGSPGKEGRRIKIYVERNGGCQSKTNHSQKKLFLKTILVASKTSWAQLDSLVCHSFLDNLKYLDADLKLSLNSDAILHYQVGEVTRTLSFESPELLPFGYLVGDVDNIKVILKNPSFNSIDSLAFETLIPKPHLQRYITLLKEHRRVILEGPEGVGKSYLAQKMAEFVVQRLGIEPSSGNIAKFRINDGMQQDLPAYLSHLSDLCESKSSDLPLVIILESLERVQKLQEALSCSLRVPHDQCPFIIGTCRHSRNRKLDPIQLNNNNFRWISLNPNFEPVHELLNRICRRHSSAMNRHSSRRYRLDPLLEWLPRCLDKVNAVLSSSSSVGPIGPGVLLPFPEDLSKAEGWFFDVWKRRLLPYLQKAAEDACFIPHDLRSWQELDTCLREELPWSFSEDKGEVALPRMPKVELNEKEGIS